MIRKICNCLIVLLFLFISDTVFSVNSKQSKNKYYVSVHGNDSNDGTLASPWHSLKHAVASIPKHGIKTIYLGEGVFTENEPMILPPSTSIVGKGMGKTIMKSTIFMKVTHHQMKGVVTRYLIQVYNSKKWEISDITFDGLIGKDSSNVDQLAFAGIFASNVDSFKIHNVALNNFIYNGLWVQYATNFEIFNASFDNDGWGDKEGCNGLIQVGSIKNAVFHDIKIREYRGNDGIRTMQTPKDNLLKMSFANLVIENVKLYNLDIKLRRYGAWGQGQPNEDIAFWNCGVINSEISHCRIADKIANQGFNNKIQRSTRIHHNQFAAEPCVGPVYTYQIEHETYYSELDNNIFLNGITNLANWNGSNEKFKGYDIHHNLFYHPEGHSIFYMLASVVDLKFQHNFILMDDDSKKSEKGQNPLLTLCKITVADSIAVRDNLFSSDNQLLNNSDLLFKKDSGAILGYEIRIEQNIFKNWRAQGTKAVTVTDVRFNHDDFRFAYDSPIFAGGLKNLDIESIGLTKDYFFSQPNDPLGMVWVKRKGGNSSEILIHLNVGKALSFGVSGRTSTGFVANLCDATVTYISDSPEIASLKKDRVTGLKKGIARIDALVTKNGVTRKSAIYVQVN